MQPTFTDIYNTGKWWNGSGSGSEPKNVKDYCKFLEEYIRKNNIKSVLDLGCGDWKFSHLINWDGISYTGVDVVPHVIEANKRKYGSDTIKFLCADINNVDLIEADLVIIKDVLQHWSNEHVQAFKPRLSKYSKILVINTVRRHDTSKPINGDIKIAGKLLNDDITTGEFRPLDLTQPPFKWDAREIYRYSFVRYDQLQEEVGVLELL